MEQKNNSPTLFDTTEGMAKKAIGNPHHARNGKFTNKYIARAEHAEKRAAIAENQLEYINSLYTSIGRQFARVSRELEQVKTELNKIQCQK